MNSVYDANNLYKGALNAKKGSAWKPEVQKFMWNWLLNITELQHDLIDQTYTDSPGVEFLLSERGHTRRIVGKRMRDRVTRHSLCDNVLTPAISPKLIYANCASQMGKGITLQREILVKHLRNYYHHHGNDGYILLMDFSKFYDNIRHDVSMELLQDVGFDDFTLWLTKRILQTFEIDMSHLSDEDYAHCIEEKFNSIAYYEQFHYRKTRGEKMMAKSLDIGDQTSQVLSIFYPYQIDNYVKIVRGMKYYGRYMDDSYIITQTKEELLSVYKGIVEIAQSLGIFINEEKTRIVKLSEGFRFLQVKYALTDTGTVIQKINPKRLTAMRRKLKKLAVKVEAGERSYMDVENMFRSWMSGHYKLMSRRQIQNMYILFNKLFHSGLEYKHGQYHSHDRSGGRDENPCRSERVRLYNRTGYQ